MRRGTPEAFCGSMTLEQRLGGDSETALAEVVEREVRRVAAVAEHQDVLRARFDPGEEGVK
jgi:predicted signal transduction protein with EAL and GGDEF domain